MAYWLSCEGNCTAQHELGDPAPGIGLSGQFKSSIHHQQCRLLGLRRAALALSICSNNNIVSIWIEAYTSIQIDTIVIGAKKTVCQANPSSTTAGSRPCDGWDCDGWDSVSLSQ